MISTQPRPPIMERPPSGTPEPEAMDSPGSPKSSSVSTTTMPKSLPPGWKREVVVRKNGLSAGKSDVYYYSPCGKKFRSKPQIAKFLGENHNLDLSCFDFSRGAYGEVTQRRRARDRQISRKMESVKPIPVVKPLSVNPLRASGPIRRTCGVIKLPVTWVAPPDDDQGTTNFNTLTPSEQKSQIHVIVQSLWEKRLFGVKPYDHMTGDEIAEENKVEVKPITPMMSKPHSPRNISPIPPLSHSPTSLSGNGGGGGGVPLPIKSAAGIIPTSSFRHHHQTPSSGGGAPLLLPTLLKAVPPAKARDPHQTDAPALTSNMTPNFSVIQQTGQPIIVPQHTTSTMASLLPQLSPSPHQRLLAPAPPTTSLARYPPSTTQFTNGVTVSSSKPPVVSVAPMVTDRELKLQEERVRLLRQRLLAAAGCGGQRPSS
jgi:hypothetical protein